MHIITLRVPSSEGPGWATVMSQAVPDGAVMAVHVPSSYLVAAGQTLEVHLSVSHMPAGPEPGEGLLKRNAAPLGRVVIGKTWDCTYIPSERFLWQIMQDVADHGRENPSHGPSCVCMDHYAREIKLHISRAIPPDTGENRDVRHRVDARARVAHVLRMVEQWL